MFLEALFYHTFPRKTSLKKRKCVTLVSVKDWRKIDGVDLLWWRWQLFLTERESPYVSLGAGAVLAMLTQEMENLGHRVAGLESLAAVYQSLGHQGRCEASKLVTAPSA